MGVICIFIINQKQAIFTEGPSTLNPVFPLPPLQPKFVLSPALIPPLSRSHQDLQGHQETVGIQNPSKSCSKNSKQSCLWASTNPIAIPTGRAKEKAIKPFWCFKHFLLQVNRKPNSLNPPNPLKPKCLFITTP